jgi:signal transduction histidine kinase
VRATATAHRGRVEVDGACFTLVLPLAQSADAEAPPGG